MGLLPALVLVLGGTSLPGGLQGTLVEEPKEHFLFQKRAECHFQNGTQRVRLLWRHIWDRQELLYFDSDLGKYVGVTELGEAEAERRNQNEEILWRQKAQVDLFCRHDYEINAPLVHARRVQPRVKITPTNHLSSSGPNTLLACDVAKFFPSKIQIKWLKNGKELEEPIWTTGLTRNGDWSFRIQAMLEMQPERGDVYACWVDHASFEEPVMVQWEAQSDAARRKMWTGIVGAILGLAFVAAGLTFYLCS